MHFKYGEPDKVTRAKQRASIAWLVQKAHKNKVPSDFEDPYYKDYEGSEHLKPGIVHRLSNADLYCSALASIYGDPNFHNLSHWNIIQALARKGVYVAEPTDVALTETVLIQTTPIKMSAHLAVTEALMSLYIREVVIAERVVQSIQRIQGLSQIEDIPTPQDHEEAIVLWVEHTTQALQARIYQQLQPSQELPVFPKIQDLSDLSDGIGLAALVAFYCPQELSWGDIAVADPPSMADSLYNIELVIKFCRESLPYNPCLLTKEDIVYMHSSVKQNILAFVAELFFLLELEPVSCVATSKKATKYIQLSSPAMKPAGIPSVRRSHSMNLNDVSDSRSRSENAPSSQNSDYGGRESSMSDGQEGGEFMVQKAKGFATLNDIMRSNSSSRTQAHEDARHISKEHFNVESKEEEMGERSSVGSRLSRKGSFKGSSSDFNPPQPPAGLPSRLDQRPAGRSRSRRNSINAEESQLTIENFGGSQDNLNWISRNPDKEPYIHSGKRDSCYSSSPSDRRRSSSQTREFEKPRDLHKPSEFDELDNRVVDKLERDALEHEKRYGSRETISREHHRRRSKPDPLHQHVDSTSSGSEASFDPDKPLGKATSFAELSKLKEHLPGGINIIYMQSDDTSSNRKTNQAKGNENKKTTFAALPNQTTWKQQSVQSANEEQSDATDVETEPQFVSSELHNVRLKLEEKRRRIESEKRKMELMMNKQRQKLGKEAFMQAVVKGDLGTEVSNVSKKWLDNQTQPKELRTPDMDGMGYEEYQQSISQMTDSLTEIQGDIQRLSSQQHQIQSLMHNGVNSQQQNQFYLHDQQQGSPSRRMWGQQPANEGYSSMSPATRRAQWGPPARPMVPQGQYMMSSQQQHQPPSSYYPYVMNQQQLPPLNQMGQQAPSLQQSQGGFMLHNQPHSFSGHPQQQSLYQNGGQQPSYYSPEQQQYREYASNYIDPSRGPPPSAPQGSSGGAAPFRLHNDDQGSQSSSGNGRQYGPQKSPSPSRQVSHAPVAAPPQDDMEPQSVCFIDGEQQQQHGVDDKFKRLSIQSGSRTYRVTHHEPGSPTRPSIGTKTFKVPSKKAGTTPPPVYDHGNVELQQQRRSQSPADEIDDTAGLRIEPLDSSKAKKGFYILLEDDDAPKKPKPPLRTKKMSQKKLSTPTTPTSTPNIEELSPVHNEISSAHGRIESSPSYGSLKIRRSSSNVKSPPPYASRSDILSPSSSATSSVSLSRLSHWNPQSMINKNDESDDSASSDVADDDSEVKIFVKKRKDSSGTALVIGEDLVNQDSEMERKKERLMMMSMRRKQQQEELRRKKEMESELKREEEKSKEYDKLRKKEEERARREMILERHKVKKAIEEAEKEGRHYNPPAWYYEDSGSATPNSKSSSVRMRNRGPSTKPRPKTMHETSFGSTERLSASRGKKGSAQNIATDPSPGVRKSSNRWGSSGSLSRATGSRGSTGSLGGEYSMSRAIDRGHSGRRATSVVGETGGSLSRRRERSRGSLFGSRSGGLADPPPEEHYQVHESRRPSLAPTRSRTPYKPSYDTGPRKYRSTGNLYGEHESMVYHMSEDSGLGRATPPRRAPSPGVYARHLPSPSGPGSLPPGLFSRRRPFDDNMSDISVTSSNIDYCGPRLFKQPRAKSNRNIILNAVEYSIFPGVVNQTAKHRVMEEVARSESKHFLVLFRDSGCQFRALYSYNPDLEEVYKLYGTGPKQVTDRMFEKFLKYNSGGKCFSEIHTKHLTVTIDAFTIHNLLWQGKRVNLPSKKDMKLVI